MPGGRWGVWATVCVVAVATAVVSAPDRATAHVPHDVIMQIVPSPAFGTDQTVFVVSRGELLRSTDGGQSWQEIVSGVVRPVVNRIAAAPTDASQMYMVLGGGVFRSQDQGLTWAPTMLASRTDIADVAVSRTIASTVFATGAAGGLFRSTDSGQSWAPVGAFGRLSALAVPTAGHVVVGDVNGAIWSSTDDGDTWTEATGTPSGQRITALSSPSGASSPLFAGTSTGGLYRSVDDGATFTVVGGGLPAELVTGLATSTTYATDANVWASTWHSVYRSTDGGATFVKSASGLTIDIQAQQYGVPDFNGVVAAPTAGGDVLFTAGFDGLFRSNDVAASWFEIETELEPVVGLAVSPNFAQDHTLIATTYIKGAFISHDAGATWATADVGLGYNVFQPSKFLQFQRLQDVVYSPDFVHDHTIFMATIRDLRISADAGATWTTVHVESAAVTESRYVIGLSPNYATDHTIFLGSKGGRLFRSTARGAAGTWSQIGFVNQRVATIMVSPAYATDHTIFVSTQSAVYRSTNSGATWTASGPSRDNPLLAISPAYPTDQTIFAGTQHGLFVSRDGGQTWALDAPAPLTASTRVQALAASPTYSTDHTLLVSVMGQGLYRSTDAGKTFSATGASLLAQNVVIADFENPSSIPIQFSPTYATDHTVFGFFDQFVVRSTDGGTTWTVLGLPPAASLRNPPTIASPSVPAVLEGGPGTTKVVRIPVALAYAYRTDVTVRWSTVDGTTPGFASSADGDFVAASGTLTFHPVSDLQYINVTVNGDATVEPDETLLVQLSGPTNAALTGNGQVKALIRNDD